MSAPMMLLGSTPSDMREHVIERFAALLESHTRSQIFANSIADLVRSVYDEIADSLGDSARCIAQAPLPPDARATVAATLERAMAHCMRLDRSIELLVGERQRQWRSNRGDLRHLMVEFDQTARHLSETLIEKHLLERQSLVLESIVLSHEKVTQWRAFVQEVLQAFHAFFSFDVFFIAFAEDNSLALYVYYMNVFPEASRRMARDRLASQMVAQLGLPANAPLDIEEFQVGRQRSVSVANPDDVKMITVQVPDQSASDYSGLLGIAYGASQALSMQEYSVVQSILAVMVMVVGSSKTLSRTLSELEYYSNHDPLTGLYNRRYFNEVLEYEIGRSERHQHEFSILMLDLDDFKDVNDTYGHPCGDSVLMQVAGAVRDVLRKGDLATRIGGDEFACILVETGAEGARVVAEKLRTTLRDMVFQDEHAKTFHITTSVGVVTYPGDAKTVSDLMAGVDLGLYRAKELGKDAIASLDALADRISANRATRGYAETLRNALLESRVIPYYQTILDSQTGEAFGFETLARIQEPDGQTIAAGAFIETIEKYGLGRELDRAIIGRALADVRKALDEGRSGFKVFINLSAQEIQGRGVLGYAENVCLELGIPPEMVVFEILERDAISDMTHMRTFLTDLRKKGFLFALDDFGSGYNSFHYLRELSFNFVKIDGTFVRNIVTSRIDNILVRNLTRMCREMGVLTIAEFVESEEIYRTLQDMGVDYVQGFHLGIPEPRIQLP
jgi:diguanylate cyclase (GGDEF)-like protein